MKIENVSLVKEMETAYMDYSMAVLLGRAIPSLYDGLKPSSRRILTAMKWLGLSPESRYMKAARVEGETMGKLHPHSGAYGAMVTMAAWWSNNNPLIDGHGNWGSPTDNAAAPRYTECKLTPFAWEVLLQNSDTWETKDNYDGSLQEPVLLNVKFPVVLVNGGEGIGVGYSTKIPPHNLRGVVKALELVSQGNLSEASKSLVPDFPTGCDIVKDEGLLEYLQTGSGSIRMRALCEEDKVIHGKTKRTALVFTNLPMHTNTEIISDQIREGIEKGKISTVADVRDETDRSGIRLVVVLKTTADVEQAKSELFSFTTLDSKFSAKTLVIDGLEPVQIPPVEILVRWLKWRDGKLVNIFSVELTKSLERLEIVEGLIKATDDLDQIIDLIRNSNNPKSAKVTLIKEGYTEPQALAILAMKLSQLTKLDTKELKAEERQIKSRNKELEKLLGSEVLRSEFIVQEVNQVADRFGNSRRSQGIETPVYTVDTKKSVVDDTGKVVKNRYMKVDLNKGIISQMKTTKGSNLIVPDDQKVILITDNGMVYKIGSKFKGPLDNQSTKVLVKTLSSKSSANLLGIWKIGNDVFANVLNWETLSKTTVKGKRWMPEEAELVYLGTKDWELKFNSGRKKPKTISVKDLKSKTLGGRGTKLGDIKDILI
jgi:DNA gyrase subunit A